jgi:arsenite methyltransferase
MTSGAGLAGRRERVRRAYGEIARAPHGRHPFSVGRRLAERAGYPEAQLSAVPAGSVEAFAGVSCLPCFVSIPARAAVLDLGCGAGLDALLMAPQAASVLGVDFSREMLTRARGSAEAMGLSNLEFRLGDAEAIPAATGSIDVALVNGIFNLNPARELIFSELSRVVRPGGQLFVAELILKGPPPAGGKPGDHDWFA